MNLSNLKIKLVPLLDRSHNRNRLPRERFIESAKTHKRTQITLIHRIIFFLDAVKSSPVVGTGVGIDNIAFLSWFQYGGGKELYDQLCKEMKSDIKGFMLQPVDPEAYRNR